MRSTAFFVLAVVTLVFSSTAAAVDVTLLGPQKLERTTGAPNVFTLPFPGVAGSASVTIENGDADGTGRVSSAVVSVNGEQVFGPRDFSLQVGSLTGMIPIAASNQLVVELRSAPGSQRVEEVEVLHHVRF